MAKPPYQKPQPTTDASAAPTQEQIEQTEQTSAEQQTTDKVEGAEPADQTQPTQEGSTEEDPSDKQPLPEGQSGDQAEQQSTESAPEPGETKPAESTEPTPTVIEPVTGAEQTQTTPVVEPATTTDAGVGSTPVELTESATERFASEAPQVSTLRQELQNYIGVMAPNRRIDPAEGAGHQTALARLIESTITEPDSRVFIAKMSVWLETIRDHRTGVFSERYVNRFAENIALSKAKLQSFQYLMHLFLTTADGTPVNASIQMDTALRGVNPEFSARLRQYVERVTKR